LAQSLFGAETHHHAASDLPGVGALQTSLTRQVKNGTLQGAGGKLQGWQPFQMRFLQMIFLLLLTITGKSGRVMYVIHAIHTIRLRFGRD